MIRIKQFQTHKYYKEGKVVVVMDTKFQEIFGL